MQLPKLTPLQSRLLASALATCLLVVIWISFQPHHFVYAAELPLAPEDLQHSQFGQSIPPASADATILQAAEDAESGRESGGGYMPDFAYFDRSLIGRATDGVETLTNNVKKEKEMNPGTTQNFVLEKIQMRAKRAGNGAGLSSPLHARGSENASERDTETVLEDEREEDDDDDKQRDDLGKRQNGRQVYISANTCRQPSPNVTLITGDPPQLTLYVSTSTSNQKPGANATDDLAREPIPFHGGYANFSVQIDSDVYIGVSAPSLTQGWVGSWQFEIAASVDGYYHAYNPLQTFLFMVDTDSEAALFVTPNLTAAENNSADIDKWLDMNQVPFTMYAFPEDQWSPLTGLERSFCGLQEQFDKTNNITVAASVTTKFGGNVKGQFHVQGLEVNKNYTGFLAVNGTADGLNISGNGIVPGGGQVWRQFNWTTKADDSCQVVFDLNFCSDIAYAVPSSSQFKSNSTGLAALYDQQAEAYYKNFTNSLEQVACDTTGTAQYSLARTCDDCSKAYKDWLCSVLMPRCEDFSATDSNLQPRNIGAPFPNGSVAYSNNMTQEFNEMKRNRFAYKQSRNPMIDEVIQPGPYKELLPCEDLCFDIVRSCPAQLGFACPNEPARSLTYGKKNRQRPDILTCNFPGAVVSLNSFIGGVGARTTGAGTAVLIAIAVGGFLWV